jgi:hypothetical protein
MGNKLLLFLQFMKEYLIVRFICFIIISVFFGCKAGNLTNTTYQKDITGLRFLGEYIIPHNQQFKNTTIGGLSGIDYDKEKDLYYLISDDWSQINPARFYTAKIFLTEKGIDSVLFLDATQLLRPDGSPYPGSKQDPYHTADPEAIRYNPLKKNFVWTSEGERLITKDSQVLVEPAIRIIDEVGKQIDSFPLPSQTHMYVTEKGLRRNGVFEGLSFADGYRNLYVSIEEPIYEDGGRAGLGDTTAWIRVLKYDAHKKTQLAQYAYKIDPVVRIPEPANGFKINGVSDILEGGKNQLVFVERSFSSGRTTDCNIRVYLGDVSKATNLASVISLKTLKKFKSIRKRLVFNMDSLGMYIGNVEGVTFGPVLPNGNRTIIFVADNNFRATEKTQFLLFELIL